MNYCRRKDCRHYRPKKTNKHNNILPKKFGKCGLDGIVIGKNGRCKLFLKKK